MQKLEILKNTKLNNITPPKKLRIFKTAFLISVVILIIFCFASLGLTGSNFMIWKDMQTNTMQSIMNQHHINFFKSQQLIIAFDVLCFIMVLCLTYSVFKFYTKGNFIIIIISFIFWLIRWSSSIFFLSADSDLQQQNQKKLSMIYDAQGRLNPLCKAQQCTGQLLNYVECGKILIWKQVQQFQIGFIVATILIGIVFFIAAYKTNKLDVKLSQNDNQLNQSRD